MRKRGEDIPGLQEDIHPGVWQRQLLLWAPKKWTMCWMALCGMAGAKILFSFPFVLEFPLFGLWSLGQYGLVLLTKWDLYFDDVLIASFKTRRYRKRYEAG